MTRVHDPDDPGEAERVAVRILQAAAQTEVSLRRRLQERGVSAAVARATAAAMAAHGYIDDDAYAQSLADRRLRRGYGRAWVAAELRSRGVGERPLEEALRGVGEEDEREAAGRAARAAATRRPLRPGEDLNLWAQRLAGSLQRRGFPMDAVRQAVRELMRDAGTRTLQAED